MFGRRAEQDGRNHFINVIDPAGSHSLWITVDGFIARSTRCSSRYACLVRPQCVCRTVLRTEAAYGSRCRLDKQKQRQLRALNN